MAENSPPEQGIRHSAVYSYLRPILMGRRVLELGCGTGESAAHLARLGARNVVGADDSGAVAEARTRQREAALTFVTMTAAALEQAGPFDVVLIPEATDILQDRGPVPLPAVLKLVATGGRLICVVPNGDRSDISAPGVSYYDIVDRLSPHFPKVRMFGQTRFAAWGIAEFDEAQAELRVEPDLAQAENETPSHYLALCGHDEALSLGYALVQIPARVGEHSPVQTTTPELCSKVEGPDAALAELRHKLAEAQGQADGLVRVSRAQSEEIEELRGRVRRTAEARAELDDEVQRLRRALLEADESVVNLTRKTTDEMTALAQRLTAGLRPIEPLPAAGLADELKRREAELAERESALSERDDRIAALEAARQAATWRAEAAEDDLGRVRAQIAEIRQTPALAGPVPDELLATLKSREQALDEFQRAAAAHLDEAGRLRDALNEQSSLVAELEEDLATAEKRLADGLDESARLRQSLAEVEEADRQRRSRLAELEGVMLRLEHSEAAAHAQGEAEQLKGRITDFETQVVDLRDRLGETERRLADSLRLRDDTERARKQSAARAEELELQLQASAARVSELESRLQSAKSVAARTAELEAKLAIAEAAATQANEHLARLKMAEAAAARARELEALLRVADSKMARLAELEAQSKMAEETAAKLAELRAEAPDPEEVFERLIFLEAQHDAAMLAAARVPSLEAELAAANACIAELRARNPE
ncbi:MAG TPA: methyltransferase domain-containing protein [Polyangia bacterium]|nr:methyltransferase domain-containing protein [Polyangia bacterium]